MRGVVGRQGAQVLRMIFSNAPGSRNLVVGMSPSLREHTLFVGVHLNLEHRRRDESRVRDTCATTRAANAGAWRCLSLVTCLGGSLLSQLQ